MIGRRTKSLSLLAGLVMLFATALLGADIDGKWSGEVKTPDGSAIEITMSFKADGDKVTGTVTGPAGDVTITDGKMAGDSLSFVIDVDANGQQMNFKCAGKLKGDELNMKLDGGGDLNFEFTAKRAGS